MEKKPDWEGFGRAVMEDWPECLPDDLTLQDLAEDFGLIRKVPGGYDPAKHDGPHWVVPEPGDDWFVLNYKDRC